MMFFFTMRRMFAEVHKIVASLPMVLWVLLGIAVLVIGETTLAVFGWYTPVYALGFAGVVVGVGCVLVALRLRQVPVWSPWRMAAVAALIVFIAFHTLMLPEAVRGRDHTSYIAHAFALTQFSSLRFTSPLAQTFHGFIPLDATTATSQFFPGYTSVLGIVAYTDNWRLVDWINVPLFALLLWVVFSIGASVRGDKTGFFALLFFGTQLASFWFPRLANAENLAAPLLLGALLAALIAWRGASLRPWLLGLVLIAATQLVRSESWIYALLYGGLFVSWLWLRRAHVVWRTLWRHALWLVPVGVAVFVRQTYLTILQTNYAQTNSGQFIDSLGTLVDPQLLVLVGGVILCAGVLGFILRGPLHLSLQRVQRIGLVVLSLGFVGLVTGLFVLHDQSVVSRIVYQSFTVIHILIYYGLPLVVVPIIVAWRSPKWASHWWIILVWLLPTVLYVIDPVIALDQPWFLRRFYPVFLPLFFVIIAYALERVPRKIALVVVVSILALHVVRAWPIGFTRDYVGARAGLDQLATLLPTNPQKSFVMLESGWGWQQWAFYWQWFKHIPTIPTVDNIHADTMQQLLNDADAVYYVSLSSAPMPLWFDGTTFVPVGSFVVDAHTHFPPLWGVSQEWESGDGFIDPYWASRRVEEIDQYQPSREVVRLYVFRVPNPTLLPTSIPLFGRTPLQ